MENLYVLPRNNQQTQVHLLSCLQKYEFGSKEYILAQKTFRWFCTKTRFYDRVEAEANANI